MKIKILGNLAGLLGKSRDTSAVALVNPQEWMLFDAGPMILEAIEQAELKLTKLSTIYISHSHADHLAGLITLITQLSLRRTQPVTIYAPKAVCEWLKTYLALADITKNQFIICDFETCSTFTTSFGKIQTYQLGHSVACELVTKATTKLNVPLLQAEGIPTTEWKQYRQLPTHKYQLTDPGKHLGFIFDTNQQQLQAFQPQGKLAFCLIECTFLAEEIEKAEQHQHLTTSAVNEFYQTYAPEICATTHFSRKNEATAYREQLQAAIFLAEAGQEWEV